MPDGGEIRVAGACGRGADADEDELGRGEHVRCGECEPDPLPVSLQQLGQAWLVDRRMSCREVRDALRQDVPHDHFVSELREARRRDEADPARAHHADSRTIHRLPTRGGAAGVF